MIPRVLEPELMDTDQDAREYDAMDHTLVNAQFVTDLLFALARNKQAASVEILDPGAGTAQIPIELCRRAPDVRVVAVDAAERMLAVARENVAAAGLADRIELVLADAKQLPFAPDRFPVVISNSILHHIAEPQTVVAEAVRVAAPGGLQFHRDLCRPDDETKLANLVADYAGEATEYQRKLFADSLRAALTVAEIAQLAASFALAPETVEMTSDRHWTWAASV